MAKTLISCQVKGVTMLEQDNNIVTMLSNRSNFRLKSGSVTSKLRNSGRRQFLKVLASLGASTSTLSTISKEAAAKLDYDPSHEVIRTKAYRHTNHQEVINGAKPEREAVHYTIPVEQWGQITAPYNAVEKIKKQIPDLTNVGVGVSFENQDPKIGVFTHDTTRALGEKDNLIQSHLPDFVSGVATHNGREFVVSDIPVDYEGERKTSHEAYFEGPYRPVPAGCDIGCTIAFPAYDTVAEVGGWETAAHCVDRDSGEPIYQPGGGSKIGESLWASPEDVGDVTFIETTGPGREYDFAKDNSEEYMGWYLYGTLARDAIQEIIWYEDSLPIQGSATGRHMSAVPRRIIDDDIDWIEYNNDYTDFGDSGCAYFHLDSYNEAYAAGVHSGTVASDGDEVYRSWGNAQYSIEDYYPVYV